MALRISVVLLILSFINSAFSVQYFKHEPADKSAKVGDSVSLKCTVISQVGQISWFKDGTRILTEVEKKDPSPSDGSSARWERFLISSKMEVDFESTLLIIDLEVDDSGLYECVAWSKDGAQMDNTKASAKLKVTGHAKATPVSKINLTGMIVGGLIAIVAFISTFLGIMCFLRQRKRRLNKRSILRSASANNSPELSIRNGAASRIDLVIDVSDTSSEKTSLNSHNLMMAVESSRPNNEPHMCVVYAGHYNRDQLRVQDEIGSGSYGVVYRAILQDVGVVAVKTLKEKSCVLARQDLMRELSILRSIRRHPNIVMLLGYCLDKDPPCVIYELIQNGNLQELLVKSRKHIGTPLGLSAMELIGFALQVSKGMAYIASMQIVHRDLAARNILISENHVCKISDFGMAKQLGVSGTAKYEKKRKGRRPLRWLAPECIFEGVFTAKSDVWSFGVLLYEIVTLGSMPYANMTGEEVVLRLNDGYRMPRSPQVKPELYELLLKCWHDDPVARPTFDVLSTRIWLMSSHPEACIDLLCFKNDMSDSSSDSDQVINRQFVISY